MDAQTAQLKQICCTGPILRPLLTSWHFRLDRKIRPKSASVFIRILYKSGLQIAKILVRNQRLRKRLTTSGELTLKIDANHRH